jgi:hypothetical protein
VLCGSEVNIKKDLCFRPQALSGLSFGLISVTVTELDVFAKEEAMKTVAVNESLMALLQAYSDKTGEPVESCVSDAVFDWLQRRLETRVSCEPIQSIVPRAPGRPISDPPAGLPGA